MAASDIPEMPVRGQARLARLYALLCEAADEGRACPDNSEIAKALGYKLSSNASRSIRALHTGGLIRFEVIRGHRRVQIVATGAWTALPFEAPAEGARRRTVHEIIEIVARTAGMTPAEITSPSRLKLYTRPRKIVCHFARQEGWSFTQIGRALGGRDSTTVIEACRTVGGLLRHDKLFARLFRRSEAALAGHPPVAIALPAATPAVKQRRPLDVDESDNGQMADLRRRRAGSQQLLAALRAEYPGRCAA